MSLGRNEELLNLLRAFAERSKLVAAICGAPLVLGAAGLLDGRHFASDITTDTEGWFEKGLRAERLIALDGNILTASVRAVFPFYATILRWFGEEAAAFISWLGSLWRKGVCARQGLMVSSPTIDM